VFTTKLPVTPIVHQFITSRYGDTICLSKRHLLGNVLLLSIKKKYYHKQQLCQEKYTEYITVTYSESRFRNEGFDWEAKSIINFNQFATRLFYDHFYAFMDLRLQQDDELQIMQAYDEFLDHYTISVDVFNLEMAKKSYLRYRKSKEKVRNMVENFPKSVL
jgi:3'-phosphoadenosine 5'-phosphosulfate sulfotransferase